MRAQQAGAKSAEERQRTDLILAEQAPAAKAAEELILLLDLEEELAKKKETGKKGKEGKRR